MTGLLRILFFILIGYLLVKTVKFIKSVLKSVKTQREEERVRETSRSKSKIDKKDVIEAQFEEIEVKDNSESTE